MKTSIVFDISSPIPYLEKFWFSSYGPKCCWLIRLQDSLKCNISRNEGMIKILFDMQVNIKVLYKLIIHFECAQSGMPKVSKITSLQYFCNITGKMRRMKLIFCLQIKKKKVFFKLILLFQVCLAGHAQITQNNFAISLQYIKKDVSDKVDLLYADKIERMKVSWKLKL